MNLQDALNTRTGIALGVLLSRMPPSIGYRVADWIADQISSRKKIPAVQAVRANQWVVHKMKASAAELDRLARNTYRNSAHSLYEFWHYLPNKGEVKKMVEFEPSFFQTVNQVKEKGEGLILVLSHMANFDLVGHAAVLNGLKLHVLSYPQPPSGYRAQNKLRQLEGLELTPMSIEALRMASGTLRSGGIVATGIDRPLLGEDAKYKVRFFGMNAVLPVFHIRLALKHDVPIAVVGGSKKANGKYCVWASEPIKMKPMNDIIQETVSNAETILDIIENDIRYAPDQWAMYYPVWPEVLGREPA